MESRGLDSKVKAVVILGKEQAHKNFQLEARELGAPNGLCQEEQVFDDARQIELLAWLPVGVPVTVCYHPGFFFRPVSASRKLGWRQPTAGQQRPRPQLCMAALQHLIRTLGQAVYRCHFDDSSTAAQARAAIAGATAVKAAARALCSGQLLDFPLGVLAHEITAPVPRLGPRVVDPPADPGGSDGEIFSVDEPSNLAGFLNDPGLLRKVNQKAASAGAFDRAAAVVDISGAMYAFGPLLTPPAMSCAG
jgi:hypothetical protein